jgi:anti-sigma factor RsiW
MTEAGSGAGGPMIPFSDDEIHAYVDGQLAAERRGEIEHLIAGDPEVAARVAYYRRLNAELHRRFDYVLAEPVPHEWGPARVWRRSGRDRRAPTLRHFGTAAAWLFAGLVAGWSSHDLVIPPKVIERVVERPAPISDQAAVAYAVFTPEVRHPVEVRADEAQHLMSWLSNRMGRPIKAPVLDDAGWHLMGGRLLPVVEDPPGTRHVACQFMFERADGARLTVYYKDSSSPNGEASAFRYAEQASGIGVVYWYDDKLGYAVAGKLPKDQLQSLAREIYDQFNS